MTIASSKVCLRNAQLKRLRTVAVSLLLLFYALVLLAACCSAELSAIWVVGWRRAPWRLRAQRRPVFSRSFACGRALRALLRCCCRGAAAGPCSALCFCMRLAAGVVVKQEQEIYMSKRFVTYTILIRDESRCAPRALRDSPTSMSLLRVCACGVLVCSVCEYIYILERVRVRGCGSCRWVAEAGASDRIA
jgi:hypothetical protein